MRVWMAAAALLALGCSQEPPATVATESNGIRFEVVPPPVGEQSQLFAEGVPLAEAAAPVPDTPLAATPPPPAPRERSSRDAAAASASQEESAAPHVPLESLLRTPGVATAPPRALDLEDAVESRSGARQPGALDAWKERVRVKRNSEAIGRSGPRQGTVSQTEAGLRLPVDDAVSLEGGVRVDSRDQPGLEEPERTSIPRVGVEVKF